MSSTKQWFIDLWERIKPSPKIVIKEVIKEVPVYILRPSSLETHGYHARYFFSQGDKYTFDELTERDGKLIVWHQSIHAERFRDRRYPVTASDLEPGGQFEHFRSSILDTDLADKLEVSQ